ncbi:MAG: 5'-methylthioadenosine/adenosylhomocysteine nucleosidase [Lentisphaeraceae bacterium]|nr:5'-methylthioadenosine/adenosylhomocysteine nucleosidase [Lentisphaeraceae bacterium]
MKNIPAIVGAMDSEITMYLEHSKIKKETVWGEFVFYEAVLDGNECVICKSGIGKVLAAMVCQKLIDLYEPSSILFTGVAGALNPSLDIGDVVVSRDCIQHDIDGRPLGFERGQILFSDKKIFKADEKMIELAMKSVVDGHQLIQGRILTGDQFFTHSDIESHGYIITELKGDCIEMEGAAIAVVCTSNEVPFVIVRTVSDKADGSAVEDFSKLHHLVAGNSYSIVKQILPELEKLR